MGIGDAHSRLQDMTFADMLGAVGVTSTEAVKAIRRIERNVEKLAASAYHQVSAIRELQGAVADHRGRIDTIEGRVDAIDNRDARMLDAIVATPPPTPPPPKPEVARPTELRIRHSAEPCEECGRRWSEPVRRGRMRKVCLDCR